MIKVLDDLVDAEDELVYIGVLRMKQDSAEVPILELKCLCRESVGHQTLNNDFECYYDFISVLLIFMLKILEDLYFQEIINNYIALRSHGGVMTLQDFLQEDEELQ